jgi:RNA polymerase sporulation-specific sigma factor
MRYVDTDSYRRNSVARRNYYADHDKRLRDTIYAGVNGLGIFHSAPPKWAGTVHGVGRAIHQGDSVQAVVYRHRRKWKPSWYHIDEAGLASRYGVPPKTFRAWPDFPPPISDFGRFDPPAGEWWSLSVLSAWEGRHSRPLPIPVVAAAIAHDRTSQKNSKQDRPVRTKTLAPAAYRSAPRPIKREPLTQEREVELIRRAQNGDESARQEIIASVQPLIGFFAAHVKSQGFDFEEIISSINSQRGIYDAIDKFDPRKGYRLATFLRAPIRWAVMAYLKRERRRPPTISLSTPINKSDPESLLLGDTIVDESYDNEDDLDYEDAYEKLNGILAVLNDRERFVIESRYGLNGKSARIRRQIAIDLNISAERVRQIEAMAFRKVGLPGGFADDQPVLDPQSAARLVKNCAGCSAPASPPRTRAARHDR